MARDLKGIHHYAETDDQPPFSELLNLGMNSVSEAMKYFSGPAVKRDALSPAPSGAMWQDTDGTKRLYSVSPTGAWRQHEGRLIDIPRVWDVSIAPVYARTIVFDISSVISANESIQVVTGDASASYKMVHLASVSRGASKTTVTVRLIKYFNATIEECDLYWRIVNIG